MKKITGKVVSLVLALALVVTSFSANFAFASSKTISGNVTDTVNDDLYLVNGDAKTVDLKAWLNPDSSDFNLETKEHGQVTNVEIKAVSHVSGDKLVSASIDDDDATLKLKGKTGTEVISVLYQGDYTDPDDDNDTEYTVKGRADLTIHVYDEGDIVFGEAKGSYTPGKGLDDFETFAMNKNSTKEIGIYKAVQKDSGSPLADFETVTLVTADNDITLGAGQTTDNTYYYEMTSGDDDVNVAGFTNGVAASSELTATVGRTLDSGVYSADAKTGNVTINVKKLVDDTKHAGKVKASSDSDDKYTLKTKIEKKIDVSAIAGYSDSTNYTIEKTDSTTKLTGSGLTSTTVKDCEVVFPSTYLGKVSVNEDSNVKKISGSVGTLTIGDAKVDSIDLDNGDVDITDGKVGDVTTDADTTKTGKVEVTGGTVGNIDTTDVNDADAGTVTIQAGTVGNIKSNDTVTINSDDEDEAVTVGAITAPDVEAFADDGALTIKSIKSTEDNGTFLLKGDKLTVGSIDLDYYDTAVQFGDDDDEFVGKIAAPSNAKNGSIEVNNEDTDVTVNGSVNVDSISVDTDAKIFFDNSVTANSIDGDGSMKIYAGKLYVGESASGVILKLADTTLAAGTTVFKADEDAVDEDDFDTFGFTLSKSTGTDVDTFKIASLSFAGLAINKTSSKIAKGYSETFTASAYPNGTSLPAGATIKWELDGGSDDVFTLTSTGNTAKVEVTSIDADFASENKTTLTATLYDEDGDEMDDYEAATCDITALTVPEATSDTTKDFSVAKGSTYQFKITSATAPTFTTGTAGVFSVALASKNGNDYFYKITAIGNVGAATGIYLNGTKLLVATVKAPAFTTDTTKDVTVKGAYTLKVTAAATPTFALGTAGVFKAEFVSKTGNDYLYKISSVGAVGAKTGVYVNGVKTFVATVG
jgi:hypothetical protein